MKSIISQLLLVAAALLARSFSLVYGLLANLLIPVSGLVFIALIWFGVHGNWIGLIVIGLLLASAWGLYSYTNTGYTGAPETSSATGRISQNFIAWIGTLKYFTAPFCLVEEPGSYKIMGQDIRQLLDGGILRTGDILLRGYEGYVDGELIRRTGGAQGGGAYFSHAALYVGLLNAQEDKALAATGAQIPLSEQKWRAANPAEKEEFRNNPDYYQAGPQMVIHSMSRGVHVEDILTFLRCDYLAVIRLPETVQVNDQQAAGEKFRKNALESDRIANEIDETLRNGTSIPRDKIIANARMAGLERIGSGYDFMFTDCNSFHRFSCSEFVYYCYKSVHRYIGLEPKRHTMAGLFSRTTISPPDVFAACHGAGKLKLIWTNIPMEKSPGTAS